MPPGPDSLAFEEDQALSFAEEEEEALSNRAESERQAVFTTDTGPGPGRPVSASTNEGLCARRGVNRYLRGGGPRLLPSFLSKSGRPAIQRPGMTTDPLLGLAEASTRTVRSLLASLRPQTPRRAPGVEDKTRPSAELRAKYPGAFTDASSFRGGGTRQRASVWIEYFGDNEWARQVAGGVGFVLDRKISDDFYSPIFRQRVFLPNHAICYEGDNAKVVTEMVNDLLRTGCVEELTDDQIADPTEALRFMPLLLHFNGKKYRLCYDARDLNAHIYCPTFKMETIAKAARMLQSGDWMLTLDIHSAFHALSLQDSLRPFCCFHWGGKALRWAVVPFGVRVAPRSFTKIVRLLLARWRAPPFSIRVTAFIDDILVVASSREELLRARDIILGDLEKLGLMINVDKAALEPTRTVTYLGYVLDTNGPPMLFVPEDKAAALKELVEGMLDGLVRSPSRRFRGSEVARVVGKLLSMRYALAPARLMTRDLLACLQQLPLRSEQRDEREFNVRDYQGWLTLTDGAVAELKFWRDNFDAWNGLEWRPAFPDRVLYTDGSEQLWGAVVERIFARQTTGVEMWAQGTHPEHLDRHSLRTELNGLLESLVRFRKELAGKTIRHRTDSLGLYYGIKNGGFSARSADDLNLLVRKIWAACVQLDINLQCEYVGKGVIIHSGADDLSRVEADDRLVLEDAVFERLWRRWGPFEADLFAEPDHVQLNPDTGRRLPYFSRVPVPDRRCLGCDALASPWEGTLYAFPPLYLAHLAVEKALAAPAGTVTVLVLPDWPGQIWEPPLRAAGAEAIELGSIDDITALPEGAGRPIESDATWNSTGLRAWRVTGQKNAD